MARGIVPIIQFYFHCASLLQRGFDSPTVYLVVWLSERMTPAYIPAMPNKASRVCCPSACLYLTSEPPRRANQVDPTNHQSLRPPSARILVAVVNGTAGRGCVEP